MKKSKIYINNLQTILITGATSEIGTQIAIRFAKEDWNILCHYFSAEKKAKALKEKITNFGVDCYLFKADLSSKAQLSNLIEKLGQFNIDTLINNAGSYVVSKDFTELTLENIVDTFMINAFAPMVLSSHIFMKMKQKNFGRIVNISSIAAKYGGSSRSLHYGCSKLALEGLTKTLAREGAPYNVLVNTIRPGVIDTDFHKKFQKNMNERIALIPLKKMGCPMDVSDMAYYLGSRQNNFITNEIISISGGE